jgi:hypothetical protein
MDEARYVEQLQEMKIIPEGGNEFDYGFKHVSNKLYMILHMYAGDDAQKVIEESCDRCGFEAYRLLNIAYDPLSVDAEDQLIRSVLSIGNCSVKGIVHIESMMKEVHVRIRDLEKKSRPDDGMTLPDKGMTMAILSTLFNKMDLETKKHIRQQGARDDFTKMKKCVEQLRQMEKSLTNNKMDIGYIVEAADNHSEFVAWQDAGCHEWGAEGEWSEDAAQGD